MTWDQRVVVITGVTSGLGLALAIELRGRGAVVVGCGRSTTLPHNLAAAGIVYRRADVTRASAMESLAQWVVTHYGRIDYWINNAGVWLPHAPSVRHRPQEVARVFEVNVYGTINGCRAAWPMVSGKRGGTIVNIISTSALSGRPNSGVYCASKYAVRGFTESLQAELNGKRGRVLAVYPGGMRTHLFDRQKPMDYKTYMDPIDVARKIVAYMAKPGKRQRLVIRRRK